MSWYVIVTTIITVECTSELRGLNKQGGLAQHDWLAQHDPGISLVVLKPPTENDHDELLNVPQH